MKRKALVKKFNVIDVNIINDVTVLFVGMVSIATGHHLQVSPTH